MANTSGKKPNVKNETINEVSIDDKIENNSDEKDELITKLQKQMLEMQEAFIKMQANQSAPSQTNTNDDMPLDKLYEIGSRFVNGLSIFSPNKEVLRDIPFNDVVTVDDIELNNLLKSNFVREFFEKDIIYFNDETLYKRKRIKKKFELDDKAFVNFILNNSTAYVVDTLNTMTNGLKDDPMVHCIFYRIVELCYSGKLVAMSYETRKAIEKMFEFKVEDAQMLFSGFKTVVH
jgi:hypothetical protein